MAPFVPTVKRRGNFSHSQELPQVPVCEGICPYFLTLWLFQSGLCSMWSWAENNVQFASYTFYQMAPGCLRLLISRPLSRPLVHDLRSVCTSSIAPLLCPPPSLPEGSGFYLLGCLWSLVILRAVFLAIIAYLFFHIKCRFHLSCLKQSVVMFARLSLLRNLSGGASLGSRTASAGTRGFHTLCSASGPPGL